LTQAIDQNGYFYGGSEKFGVISGFYRNSAPLRRAPNSAAIAGASALSAGESALFGLRCLREVGG
jgi:hypothetical protein